MIKMKMQHKRFETTALNTPQISPSPRHGLLSNTVAGLAIVTMATLLWLGIALQAHAEDTATLNFEDADISAVISTVSAITGKNFIIDPRVKGKVTVLSPEPLTPDGVYQTFLSILQVHGFAAIPSGDSIKIVPETDAKQGAGKVNRYAPADEIVTRVIEVENVPSAQLVPILRPLVPQYGHLAAYAPSNMLIISDRAANVARMEDIIRRIDQTTEKEIDVINLQHAAAAEVVQTLTKLQQQAQRGEAGGQTTSNVTVVADERTNSVLIAGEKNERMELKALVAHLDTPLSREGDTQVIYLRFANAETLAPILEGYVEHQSQTQRSAAQVASEQRGSNQSVQSRIFAEPDTNALVITAPPQILQQLRSVIAQLDIRRSQVLVEAIIAEVSVTKARELGVDSFIFDKNSVVSASILDPDTLAGLGSAVSVSGSGAGTSADTAVAAALLQRGLNFAVGGGTGSGSLGFLLRALAGDGNTNILSTPTLVTLDNEEAELSVGQEVPFLTGQFTNSGTNQPGVVNPFQTIERRDVGLTLKLTPQINEGDTIQLNISQEVSSISAGSAGAVDLITNKRTLNTAVIVDDGDVLVLGGLIDDNVVESEQRVPLLGSIPLLGELFKSRSVTKNKQNLMIFIRPQILRSRTDSDYYTRQKYNYMRGQQLEAREESIKLLNNEQRPLLPDDSTGMQNRPPPQPYVPKYLPRDWTPPPPPAGSSYGPTSGTSTSIDAATLPGNTADEQTAPADYPVTPYNQPTN